MDDLKTIIRNNKAAAEKYDRLKRKISGKAEETIKAHDRRRKGC
jgi:hypothetical protein